MGGSESKAETIVKTMMTAGVSVMQTVMSENKTTVTQMNEIDIGPGCNIKADVLRMGNYAKVDMKSVTNVVMDAKFQQDVEAAVKQAADSAAKAGIGISASDSTAITEAITNISTSVTNSVKSMLQSDTVQSNILSCSQGGSLETKLIDMKNDVKTMLDQVTSSSEVTDAKQKAITAIAQEIKSLAEGMDLAGILGGIAAIVLVVVGVGLLGVGKVVNLLTSVQFWFVVALLGTVGGAGIALLRLGNGAIWPYEKGNDEHNKTVLMLSLVVGAIGGVGLGITGFMISRQKNKKVTI